MIISLSKKTLSSCLAILLIFFQTSLATAQMSIDEDSSQSTDETSRKGGASFRTRGNILTSPQTSENAVQQPFGEGAYGVKGISYQVHVLGEVNKPGTYRINASTRLSEAIEVAGGILERGSERQIHVRRRGGGSRRADLFSFKFFGNLDANPYLLDNDVVFIPLKERVVRIEGAVKRPGMYELKNEKMLSEVVELGGGFTPGIGDSFPIKVIRYNHGEKEIYSVENNNQNLKEFQLSSADVIVVPHKLTEKKTFDYNVLKLPGDNDLFYPSSEERVFVLGAVTTPGAYSYNPYYDVRQYITVAGGKTRLAKSRKIRIITSAGKTLKAGMKTEVNPGDTVIVAERYMPPESIISLVLGLTTSILGVTTTVLTLAR